jgi:phage tail-like protein
MLITTERQTMHADPHFNFFVEIEGIVRAGFQELSGLSTNMGVMKHREGGDNQSAHKLASHTK